MLRGIREGQEREGERGVGGRQRGKEQRGDGIGEEEVMDG